MSNEQKETIKNLRRVWVVLRYAFGRTEALCEDFTQLSYEVLTRDGLKGLNQNFINSNILNY